MSERIIPPEQSELVELGQKTKTLQSEEDRYQSFLEYGQQFAGNHLLARQQLEEKIRKGEVPEYRCEEQLWHIKLVQGVLKESRAKQGQWLREESAPLPDQVRGRTRVTAPILASRIMTILKKVIG